MPDKDDQLRSQVLMRRMTHKEDIPPTVMQIRSDFLMVAQGDQVLLLTKKEVFANLELMKEFVRGQK